MNAIYEAIQIYFDKYKKEGPKCTYNVIYYCKKFVKLSETKEFDKDKREAFTKGLSF
jgi:hypothetical protein